ncbi:MAG: ABC transporter ATP-binding protein [Campylobacter sp.]|nr:ABC transporter ATP-binding protein [Campylobacter sp.]
MLEIKNLKFEILRDTIIRDFSLNLGLGEVKTLFGPSGCGKTTLLRLVSGLDTPKSGEIKCKFKKIGFLFQDNRLLPNLTALQNISIFNQKPNFDEIYETACKIGLEKSDLNKFPKELSGGMQKRIAFLRLFLSGADLALLDEPFVALDHDMRDILINLLVEKIAKKELSVLLVTHDRFEAARLSHEIIELEAKFMNIKRKIKLDTSLLKRDARYEEIVVAKEFKGIVYYE